MLRRLEWRHCVPNPMYLIITSAHADRARLDSLERARGVRLRVLDADEPSAEFARHNTRRPRSQERVEHQHPLVAARADHAFEVDLGQLVLVRRPPLGVIALYPPPVLAVPHVHRDAHPVDAFFFRVCARVGVDGRAVARFENRPRIPDSILTILHEVQRVDLALYERPHPVLPEAVVPDAPVHHVQPDRLELHHDLRGGVVGDVHPQRPVRRQRRGAQIEPAVREREVFVAGQAVLPLVVLHLPVEGRVGEDEIDSARRALRDRWQHVAAIADVNARVGKCKASLIVTQRELLDRPHAGNIADRSSFGLRNTGQFPTFLPHSQKHRPGFKIGFCPGNPVAEPFGPFDWV